MMFEKGDRVNITYYDLDVTKDIKINRTYTVEECNDGLLKVIAEPSAMSTQFGEKPRTIIFNMKSARLLKIEQIGGPREILPER